MKNIQNVIIFLMVATLMGSACHTLKKVNKKDTTIIGQRKVGPQPDSSILVPSNQFLRPAGEQVYLPGRPVDLALSRDGKRMVVKNQHSLDLIRIRDRTILQSLPYPHAGASYTGLRIGPEGKEVFVSDAKDHIEKAKIGTNNIMHWSRSIGLPKPAIGGPPLPSGMALNKSASKLYVILNRSNMLGIINLHGPSAIRQIPVGIAPYDIMLASPHKAYVSNWGGRRPQPDDTTYNSSGSQVVVNPQTGVASSGTISVINLKQERTLKTIPVGLHPAGMALSPTHDTLYVACANSDMVLMVDTKTDQVMDSMSVHPQRDIPFGSAPNALTVSPDGKYLYVTNGTDNATCVIRTTTQKVMGYIPTGWYPGAVEISKTGKRLYVANVKGMGSRNKKTGRVGYNSHNNLGSISMISVPDKATLAEMTQTVYKNNAYARMRAKLKKTTNTKNPPQQVPVPWRSDQTSYFKHVVYIIKENRTYDQVLGDMSEGNGDTSLVEFGRNVTPNHHKLAKTFTLMDNYNCSGVLSADGHQWTDEAYVTDYLEKSFGGFTRSYPYNGGDALAYASSGFIWGDALRHGLSFRNYGEFASTKIQTKDKPTYSTLYNDYINGTLQSKIYAKADLAQLKPYLSPHYPSFNLTISDQYRASQFIKELKGYEKQGHFPNFIIMELPNDHTAGTSPNYPTPQSMVADNDLALGRIIDAITHSMFWKKTCIFVTEDDPQAGLDHIDGHRTVGFVISPYTKRGKTISTYYSQINMVRTIENILGLPPMNQLDLTADPMLDLFTNTPDLTPYNVVRNSKPLFQLNPALSKLKGKPLYWAKKSLEQDLEEEDRIDDDIFNQIIWHAVKGYKTPYPK